MRRVLGGMSDAGPPKHPGNRVVNWTAVGALAACLALPIMIWQGVIALHSTSGSTHPATARPNTPSASQEASGLPLAPSPKPTGSAPVGSDTCYSLDSKPTSCDESSAGVVVETKACSAQGVREALGLSDENQLDLSSSSTTVGCLAFPGSVARAEGATAVDVIELRNGRVPSRLRLCAPSVSAPEVACTEPHRIELIAPWRDAGGVDTAAVCLAAARAYADRTLAEIVDPLTSKAMLGTNGGRALYRCYIESSVSLRDSVWRLGSREPVRA